MKYLGAACALLLSAPAWALDFRRNDAFDYAQEAAAAAVRAEALCSGPINRRGSCPMRPEFRREAIAAMGRANIAIDNFYAKCEIVYRGDMSSCDILMGAFLAKAREKVDP